MLMRTRSVDFHLVEEKHAEIHRRLTNWARWVQPSRGGGKTSPMFRLYVAPARARGSEIVTFSAPIDKMDAARINVAVTALPAPHRSAIQWAYVRPHNPRKAACSLGVTLEGLAQLLRDGRQMLVNRGA